MRFRRFAPLLFACTLAVTTARPVAAGDVLADLGGEYSGTLKCAYFKNGVKQTQKFTPALHVSQTNLDLGVVVDFTGEAPLYRGLVAPSAAKPGQQGDLVLVYCGTNDVLGDDPTYDELGRLSFKGKPGEVKGTLKGSSIVSFNGGPLGDAYAGICKWSFKRVSRDPQNVPTSCMTN